MDRSAQAWVHGMPPSSPSLPAGVTLQAIDGETMTSQRILVDAAPGATAVASAERSQAA